MDEDLKKQFDDLRNGQMKHEKTLNIGFNKNMRSPILIKATP